jgi:hypothetical protein
MFNCRKIDHKLIIKYTDIPHCKTLKNLSQLGFWFENMPSGNPESDFKEIVMVSCTCIVTTLQLNNFNAFKTTNKKTYCILKKLQIFRM